jgi:hypothetical protein
LLLLIWRRAFSDWGFSIYDKVHFGIAVEYYSGAFRVARQARVQFCEKLPAEAERSADWKFTEIDFLHEKSPPQTLSMVHWLPSRFG